MINLVICLIIFKLNYKAQLRANVFIALDESDSPVNINFLLRILMFFNKIFFELKKKKDFENLKLKKILQTNEGNFWNF